MTEEQLAEQVERFYARVREDEVLGPIFNGAITDWPHHLEKLKAFWSSVMLTSGRYKGSPMAAHLQHRDAIAPEMFERWLGLWRTTADQVFVPAEADAIVEKAERIAESLGLALFFRV
ncbi:MAG: group III truncated hemoglobin [Sphingomonas sp.]|uniref:group III truncated hemoglobin n=1 Tax=Sphingomonas sp. TaxID=28214 RepID=UPI001B2CF676|nr:group III truncated hemoglobin [Sphingomonas sp.]MBO9621364.1 group III truncated hemoglobin [Sphingomonas sp.]